uniref:Uncharacterized protein n=1 Tax=Nymphaea colorata TaxID=210225 RepID=A0A5K0W604_9MAGN
MVEAPTVKIQGAEFTTLKGKGPSFPPEQTTSTPLCVAWKAPMAMGSLTKSIWKTELMPMEMEMMSTPSLTASSIPFSRFAPEHPSSEHAL